MRPDQLHLHYHGFLDSMGSDLLTLAKEDEVLIEGFVFEMMADLVAENKVILSYIERLEKQLYSYKKDRELPGETI